jgi:hypothetical protein
VRDAKPLGNAGRLTAHRLEACRVVLRIIGDGVETAILRASYSRLPTNGTFSIDDFITAERFLLRRGLLEERDTIIRPTALGATLLATDATEFAEIATGVLFVAESPMWLPAATRDGLNLDLIPPQELARLSGLIPDPARREAFLIAAGLTFDAERAREMGRLGEELMVASCRAAWLDAGSPELAARVTHLSPLSDQLGYDVKAPDADGSDRRIEVKTTGAQGGTIEIFLSRTEALVGLRDPSWRLAVCRQRPSGVVEGAGWCMIDVLRDRLPTDPAERGEWRTARVLLSLDELWPGLPIETAGPRSETVY